MNQYVANFRGRTKGAIGIFYPLRVVVKANSLEEAKLKLYETHEPEAGVHWGTLTDDEVAEILAEKGCDVEAWKRLCAVINPWLNDADRDFTSTEEQEQALYRYNWIKSNCYEADRHLIQNNIGKGCCAAGVKAPLFF